MSGYSSSTNALGIRAIRIHYSAARDKDRLHPDPATAARAGAWYDAARQLYPDPNQWAQEMEINWWVAAGTRVYPEFSEAIHTRELQAFRERKVIYRALDFGWHAPACLVAQLDAQDRLVILREVIGKEQTTKEFVQGLIAKCAAWFPDHTAGYQDFCDPAGQQAQASASEKSEVRDVDILRKLGLFPSWAHGWSRRDGRSLVHQLLGLRVDATPSMFVNALGCPVLLQGFLGKYVYPARKDGTAHDEPDEANHPWADAHAALRYLATGLYTALGLRKTAAGRPPPSRARFHGYGTPLARR